MRAELGPKTIGRIAACLFLAAGTLSVVTMPLPQPPGGHPVALFVVATIAIAFGALVYVAPWERWSRRTSLALIPIAFALTALGNAFGSTRPYSYSVFFVVAFAWIGMAHPRWTSLWWTPLAALAYVLPMFTRVGASRSDALGVLFTMPVCVLVAELIAWIVAGERRSRDSAQALVRVASALGQHLDEARLSQTLVNEARTALGAEHAVLYRIDPASMTLTAVHASGVPDGVRRVLHQLPGTKLEVLPSGITSGDPIVVADASTDEYFGHVVSRFGVKSYIAVPVMARGELVGVLACSETTRRRDYSDRELALTRALAGQASAAIENARLFEKTLAASRCDPLTGLGNRRAFRDRLENEVERARRYGRELSLIVLDCDRFKAVNDSHGHQAGDRVLERIGEVLQRNRRMEDGAFRIGGDEFAVLLPETGEPGATILAERLRRRIERATLGADRSSPLTASIGVGTFGEHGVTADDLFEHADTALYEVKAAGGNAVALPPRRTNGHAMRLGVDIESVIANELLYALYQPIFDLASGDVMGFETFCRLDPVLGHTPTATLFRAAAVAGRLADLDRTCRGIALRSAAGLMPDVHLFLNVSPNTLGTDDRLAEEICLQVDLEGVARSRVVVEVTEHERSAAERGLVRNLRAAQQAGLRIGMDDFSAAATDLDLLAAVSFDYVKVDMSFVHATSDIDSRRAVLRSLAILVRETGAEPIAEGIETMEDLRIVRDLGFAAAQGFLLREPASIPDLSPRPLKQLAAEASIA